MAPEKSPDQNFTTVNEIIERVKTLIPENIQERYFLGDIWKKIVKENDSSPDKLINLGNNFLTMKMCLAKYLINIVAQNLSMEITLAQKVDPKTKEMVDLSKEEIKSIEKTIQDIAQFVREELGIPIANDLTVMPEKQPDLTIEVPKDNEWVKCRITLNKNLSVDDTAFLASFGGFCAVSGNTITILNPKMIEGGESVPQPNIKLKLAAIIIKYCDVEITFIKPKLKLTN